MSPVTLLTTGVRTPVGLKISGSDVAQIEAIGAVWFLYLAGYNMSVGVLVGLIALLGVDAETGVFMLLYLDLAYEQSRRAGRLNSLAELRDAVLAGAVKRIRPKAMTVA